MFVMRAEFGLNHFVLIDEPWINDLSNNKRMNATLQHHFHLPLLVTSNSVYPRHRGFYIFLMRVSRRGFILLFHYAQRPYRIQITMVS